MAYNIQIVKRGLCGHLDSRQIDPSVRKSERLQHSLVTSRLLGETVFPTTKKYFTVFLPTLADNFQLQTSGVTCKLEWEDTVICAGPHTGCFWSGKVKNYTLMVKVLEISCMSTGISFGFTVPVNFMFQIGFMDKFQHRSISECGLSARRSWNLEFCCWSIHSSQFCTTSCHYSFTALGSATI